MQHVFVPDPDVPEMCGWNACGLPRPNRRHAEPPKPTTSTETTAPTTGDRSGPHPEFMAEQPMLPEPTTPAPQTGMNHPQSSFDAARTLAPQHGRLRARVLDVIAASTTRGMTDRELEDALQMSHQTVSSARNSLMEAGWITQARLEDGQVHLRAPDGKRPAQVWVLSAAGRAQHVPHEDVA